MATQKQIEANRLNSRKSTGPRSPGGKTVSSMNALKSGIDAESQIIRGEIAANLESLASEYYGRFRPTTPDQRLLVDTLIDAEWLLRRFRVCEAQLWEQGAQSARPPIHAITTGQAFQNNSDHFARLQRRIDNAHKNYRNALHELQRLKAEESSLNMDPEPNPAPPPAPRTQSVTFPNGFVPQVAPPNPIDAPPAHHSNPSKHSTPVDTENSIL